MSTLFAVVHSTGLLITTGKLSFIKSAIVEHTATFHTSVDVLSMSAYDALQHKLSPEGQAELAAKQAELDRKALVVLKAERTGHKAKTLVLAAERVDYPKLTRDMAVLKATRYSKYSLYKIIDDVLTNHQDDGTVTVGQAAWVASTAASLRSLAQQA